MMIGANAALLALAKNASRRIDDIHKAFGAPGDYGYGTTQGDALFELYKFQVELLNFIESTKEVS